MKTKRGIYLDLEFSDYVFKDDNFEYYFSSKLYLDKFKETYLTDISLNEIKFHLKHDVLINFDLPLAISLYKKIEKRGFRVLYKGKELNPTSLVFNCIIESGD